MLDALNAEQPVLPGKRSKSFRDAKKSCFFCRTHFSVSWAENPPPSCFPVLTEAARHIWLSISPGIFPIPLFLFLQASCLETEKDVLLKPVSTMISAAPAPAGRYHLRVDPSHLEAASRLFPRPARLTHGPTVCCLNCFYSMGNRFPWYFLLITLQYMDSASLDFISMLIRGRNRISCFRNRSSFLQ